jgi:ribosome-associated protein
VDLGVAGSIPALGTMDLFAECPIPPNAAPPISTVTSALWSPLLAGGGISFRAMRDLDLGDGIIVPEQLLRAVTSRSGGPGGQNVNKVETRVTIEVEVDALPLPDDRKARIRERLAGRINKLGVLRVTSQAERSQLANRDRALARMEELLRDAITEQETRKPTRISRAQKRRRLKEKKRRAETKRLRNSSGLVD